MSDSYYLGSGTVLLGQAAQRGFGMDKALPILEQLNSETQESVNLSIRQGSESVVMMRVQSMLPLRFEQHTGARFPCTRRVGQGDPGVLATRRDVRRVASGHARQGHPAQLEHSP